MSVAAIRAALEQALAGIAPAIDTVWQNMPYTPVAGVPYQRVHLMPAAPENPVYGGGYREVGILQIMLRYPTNVGPADADARAQLIRDTFARGNSFTSAGVVVHIDKTATIAAPLEDPDRYCIPVRVSWYADLF